VHAAGSLGGLHGLINNAGVLLSKGLMETSHDDWARIVRVNQTGCFLGLQVTAPAIARSGGGSIVNVSSIAGLRGSPRNFAYAATKWALRGMTRAAAVDLAPQGIRVNAIYPGSIDTEMLSFWTPQRRDEWLRRVPMGRMASPDEAARVALFLLSDESSFVTGAEIAVDGGSAAS
jgi:3alpha(or 20beta)-hydroxysteroid dehydrogenase